MALVAGIAQRVGVLRCPPVDAVHETRIASLDQGGAQHITPSIIMLSADAMEIDQRRRHQTPSCDTPPSRPPLAKSHTAATGQRALGSSAACGYADPAPGGPRQTAAPPRAHNFAGTRFNASHSHVDERAGHQCGLRSQKEGSRPAGCCTVDSLTTGARSGVICRRDCPMWLYAVALVLIVLAALLVRRTNLYRHFRGRRAPRASGLRSRAWPLRGSSRRRRSIQQCGSWQRLTDARRYHTPVRILTDSTT